MYSFMPLADWVATTWCQALSLKDTLVSMVLVNPVQTPKTTRPLLSM